MAAASADELRTHISFGTGRMKENMREYSRSQEGPRRPTRYEVGDIIAMLVLGINDA
jgi:hypothetical protein